MSLFWHGLQSTGSPLLEIVSCLEKFFGAPSYCDMTMISKDCRIAYILFIAEFSSYGDSSIACGQRDVKHKESQTWFCGFFANVFTLYNVG